MPVTKGEVWCVIKAYTTLRRGLATIEMDREWIPGLFYVDGIILVADDYVQLQAMLDVWESFARERSFVFATQKCAVPLPPDTELQRIPVLLYAQPLMKVRHYEGTAHADKRSADTKLAMNTFRTLGYNSSGLRIHSRILKYKTFLRPSLEYGLHLLTKNAARRLQTTQNAAIRTTFSLSIFSNEAIHAITGLPLIET